MAINGKGSIIDANVKRIVKTTRASGADSDRDVFDHLIRPSDPNERVRLSALATKYKADFGWLDAIVAVSAEKSTKRR